MNPNQVVGIQLQREADARAEHKGPATDADNLYQSRPGRTYGVEPEVALTPLELMQMAEGDKVYDAQGDEWTKEEGKWVCRDARLLPESLIHVWGPITKEEQ